MQEKAALVPYGLEKRVDASAVLPGYMLKLTGGYEYRTFWFEAFECLRKVLLVGVPAMFPNRGGAVQLIWGLMVCFLTFGAYMLYAPFVKDSDDTTSQLAQAQIFLSLVASIGLRLTPPDATLGSVVTVCFFIIPIFALFMETPIADELRVVFDKCKRNSGNKLEACVRRMSVVATRRMSSSEMPVHPMVESTTKDEPTTKATGDEVEGVPTRSRSPPHSPGRED